MADYKRYFDKLQGRLEAGAKQYGEASFEKPEGRLLDEIQEEILDIAGWSFILWERIERLKRKIQ